MRVLFWLIGQALRLLDPVLRHFDDGTWEREKKRTREIFKDGDDQE